ncbi:YlmC/YmxH family sporulation protein [Clostridium bovifaecis]|uniref:YlmC/YmxH family sporulation protein n=1 Tax=Clostridium bovifaecis TaxID=2184719 RepID=A0A6I6ES82_9CLOT|nr:YlmC/YmxH family sporulation protein [Clostridium bovifaecis]
MPLYSINNLKLMEVIDINTGSKLGYIKDLVIDCVDYKVLSLIIPREKGSWFTKNNNLEVQWDKIVKVGVDVILVDVDNVVLDDK